MSKRKVGYTIDATTVDEFLAYATPKGVGSSLFVEGCMKAYVAGKFKMVDGQPEFLTSGTFHVEQSQSSVEHKRPGRPPKEKEPERSNNPWERAIQEAGDDIFKYKMYQEPHPAVDPRPRLTLDTMGKVLQIPFSEFLETEYWKVRENFTIREWEGKYQDFATCCAMKFFAYNREEGVRFDLSELSEDLYTWNQGSEALFIAGMQSIHGKEVK